MGLSFSKPENIRRKNQSKLIFDITNKEIICDDKCIIIIFCDIKHNISNITDINKDKLNNIINKINEGWFMKITLESSNNSELNIVKNILVTKVFKDNTKFIEIPIEGYCSEKKNSTSTSNCSHDNMKKYIGKKLDVMTIMFSFEKIVSGYNSGYKRLKYINSSGKKIYGNLFEGQYYNSNAKYAIPKKNNNEYIYITKKIIYNSINKKLIISNIHGLDRQKIVSIE